MRALLSVPIAIGLAVGVGTAGAVAWGGDDDVSASAMGETARPPTIMVASGSGTFPSQTATDWVTYADHVVVARAVRQSIGEPSKEELEAGKGTIPRQMTYQVQEVIWSTARPDRPAPSTFEFSVWGSSFRNGNTGDLVPIASADSPRSELGRTYVIALVSDEARCSPGDTKIPAQWTTLGTDSILPFDDGIIGNGENGGRIQTAEQASAETPPDDPNYNFEDQLAGKQKADLRTALDAAKPTEPQLGRPSAPCD